MLRLPRSTFELLLRAARLVNERAIARVQRAGATNLRLAHTALFPHITDAGIRQTELADKLGVTKQAIGPLVDDLERDGVVERIPDPADARAKLVRWTAKGRRALREGLGVLAQLEAELAEEVGPRKLAALADTLEALIAAVAPKTGTVSS
ncbi:MAG TPA: MarR family transcriptional regulator [Kofleriaceae bacterium]|nr:MarR family transcriptional regulator [Kofleriaceae bacterium]